MVRDPYPTRQALLVDLRKIHGTLSPFDQLVSEKLAMLNQQIFAPLNITLIREGDLAIAVQQEERVPVGHLRMLMGLMNTEAESLVIRLLEARKTRLQAMENP
jgi:hypothetical protein